jgi:hypothetical protein
MEHRNCKNFTYVKTVISTRLLEIGAALISTKHSIFLKHASSYLQRYMLLPSHGVLLHFLGEGTSGAPPRQLCKQHNKHTQQLRPYLRNLSHTDCQKIYNV